MGLSSLTFLIEEAGKNIRRNGLMSLAALTTVVFSMAVLGGALLALYRLHQYAEAQTRRFEMEVFLQVGLPREETMRVKRRIQALPDVAHVNLVTREEAWALLQEKDRERGDNITAALEGENPLPDRLDVRLSDPRRTAPVAALLRDSAKFPEINRVLDAQAELDTMLATSRLITTLGAVIAGLLFLATALVIQNTIRLTVFARRREIRIMQLVGATPGFIRFPLMLEGIFYGAVGAAVASGLVLFAGHQISIFLGKFETPFAPLVQSLPEPVAPTAVVGLLVALGAFVGWAGSVLSIRRFLKRI